MINNLLEAKLESSGEAILFVKGQIGYYKPEHLFKILITDVMHKEGIQFHYKQFDNLELFGFIIDLYRFKDSFDEKSGYKDPSELKINVKSAPDESES